MVITFYYKNTGETEAVCEEIWVNESSTYSGSMKNKMLKLEIYRVVRNINNYKFRNDGIPGKKVKKTLAEEILKLLDYVKEIYGIENICYGDNLDNLNNYMSKYNKS